jgi:hypothetical protein
LATRLVEEFPAVFSFQAVGTLPYRLSSAQQVGLTLISFSLKYPKSTFIVITGHVINFSFPFVTHLVIYPWLKDYRKI